MYLRKLILFSFVFSSAFSSLNAQEKTSVQLSAPEFRKEIESTGKKLQLVDVRTPEEFSSEHIEGAKNINIYDNNFMSAVQQLDKELPVLVYCKGGGRSASAIQKLQQAGFLHLYELKGGLMSWKYNNYPVADNNTKKADTVTPDSFGKILSEQKITVVDFYATWCKPCKEMEPMLAHLSSKYEGKVKVVRVDVDNATELAKKINVQMIPMFVLYKDGKEVKRLTGMQSEKQLESLFK